MSLLDVSPGQRVRVRTIYFEFPVARCRTAGVEVGSVLVCVGRGRSAVEVRTEGGETHRLDADVADFVMVDVLRPGPRARPPGG